MASIKNMEEIITLSKEQKIYLAKSIQSGRIDKEEFRQALGINNPILNINLIDNGLPFAYSEEEICLQ